MKAGILLANHQKAPIMVISSKCIVLGAPGVGKTSFISKYLYSYAPPKPTYKDAPKTYKYTMPFPPPATTLEIQECIEAPESLFSSVILVYDPSEPTTLKHIEEEYLKLKKRRLPFGCSVVSLVKGKHSHTAGRKLAESLGLAFFTADIKSRNSVKRCFKLCWKWAKKNLTWEARKPVLFCRFKLKLQLV